MPINMNQVRAVKTAYTMDLGETLLTCGIVGSCRGQMEGCLLIYAHFLLLVKIMSHGSIKRPEIQCI